MTKLEKANEIYGALKKIPGGYTYDGAASLQVCFPLKVGGELRFGIYDSDNEEGIDYGFDFYDGSLPPCITGWSEPTGKL